LEVAPTHSCSPSQQGSWKPYPYLSYISNFIAECVAKGNHKIIITAPPRHGKSELLSQWLPVWHLSTWPDKNVLMASYSAELATKFGRWYRNTISNQSEELMVKISADSSSVSRWHTICGGSTVSLGVGGSITGRGADLIIADDLIKNIADAQSPALQKSLREWFKSTLFTSQPFRRANARTWAHLIRPIRRLCAMVRLLHPIRMQ
jgi:hypothetical protein